MLPRPLLLGAVLFVACAPASVPGGALTFYAVDGPMDAARLQVFEDEIACETEDPAGTAAWHPTPFDDRLWDDPLRSPAPELWVPDEGSVVLVVQGLDAEGTVRAWGCDDGSGGGVAVVLSPTCRGEDAPSATCPAGARPWRGAGGEACVAACAYGQVETHSRDQ